MKRILTLLALLLLPSLVSSQPVKPPINAVAGPTSAEQLHSIAPDVSVRHTSETAIDLTITDNTLSINLALGSVFRVTNSANISTVAITNATASRANTFRLYITSDGNARTQVWGVKWANGTQPVLTAIATRVDVVICDSPDGGSNWYCGTFGYNFF